MLEPDRIASVAAALVRRLDRFDSLGEIAAAIRAEHSNISATAVAQVLLHLGAGGAYPAVTADLSLDSGPLAIALALKAAGYTAAQIAPALIAPGVYPNLAAQQVGEILLDPGVYPATTRDEMGAALLGAPFDPAAVAAALQQLYPTAPLLGMYVPIVWFCDDIHSGANKDGAFGTPGVPAEYGYYGEAGVSDHQGFDGYTQLVIARNPVGTWTEKKPPIVAADIVIRRWEKTGHGGMSVVTLGSSDADYVSLGDFYVRNYAEGVRVSDFPGFVCVHHSLVRLGQYKDPDLWDDVGSGARDDVSLWALADQTVRSPAGTSPASVFRAIPSYPPDAAAATQLNPPLALDLARVAIT